MKLKACYIFASYSSCMYNVYTNNTASHIINPSDASIQPNNWGSITNSILKFYNTVLPSFLYM